MIPLEYKESTYVPNIIFDRYMKILPFTELKILLVIIRQTYGWIDRKTGKRKVRDRINHQQFMQKTGLSRRTVSKAVKGLVSQGLVTVGDQNGRMLSLGSERRGKTDLYYGFGQRRSGLKMIGEILGSD